MKKLLFISLIITFSFSCNKAEVRKGIGGFWKIEKFQYNYNYPCHYTGNYEFNDCSRKMNKNSDCNITRKIVVYNSALDTTYPESTQSFNFQIINRGKEMTIGDKKYEVDLNEDKLVLDEIIEGRGGKETITFSRQ